MKFVVICHNDDQQEWSADSVVAASEEAAMAFVGERRPSYVPVCALSLTWLRDTLATLADADEDDLREEMEDIEE